MFGKKKKEKIFRISLGSCKQADFHSDAPSQDANKTGSLLHNSKAHLF